MKFIHIADLHLGKSIYGTSMIENGDQSYWVNKFIELATAEAPQAVVIAGDVFDRKDPGEDAVALFSHLMSSLHELRIPVLTIAGNHDSIYRLSYVRPVLAEQDLIFSRSLTENSELEHLNLQDEHGKVTFWLMPYVFPALIARALGNDELRDYKTAVTKLLEAQGIDTSQRNVLIAHQNVTCNGKEAERGGSESMIGGVGQIDYHTFDDFDYVALGHIHAAYSVGRKSVRYAGSPLCYHFDETKQPDKGPLIVEIGAKGEPISIKPAIIEPLHRMVPIKGEYEKICEDELARNGRDEYISITLTDRRITPEIASFFRDLYKSRGSVLMELKSEFRHFTDNMQTIAEGREKKSASELFSDFYTERRGGRPPESEEYKIMDFAGELMQSAGDFHEEPDQKTIDKFLDFLLGMEGEE